MTEEMLQAIRYYEGDVSGNDPFWGDPKAYCTINSLLFSGVENEKARSLEGKRLNPAALQNTERLLSFYQNLLCAFLEGAATEDLYVYRVERLSDYKRLQEAGATISFTSTSTAGFLKAYQDKKGLALMKILIPAGTPCLNLAQVLSSYKKAEEAEVLLPPGRKLHFEEIPLTDQEKEILDADGNPPAVCAKVTVGEWQIEQVAETLPSLEKEGAAAGERIYQSLNAGRQTDPVDETLFISWKKTLQQAIFQNFLSFADLTEARRIFSRDRYAALATGLQITAVGPRYAKVELDIEEKHLNALDFVMGGVPYVMADYAFAIASNFRQTPCVTLNSQIHYLAGIRGSHLVAEAKCVKDGKHTNLFEITITDEQGQMVAMVSTTGFRKG